ncbi:MAG: SDR family oxidoreductase [Solirubrobacterales bacterium]|nr:SDR family oxidoreductase [Solirubrobacterales bacterium]MBV9363824.1 SDR family oxidoreductase [Solirubrobacterales bacterium]MBV9809655.1 SDR family oxidoreductase [Solirubrobacterales bacterium]
MRRTAVVTGGAGGIGGAIVRELSGTGHDVAILDREGEFAVDLADSEAVHEVAGRLGPRDVLVHAAAAFDRAALEQLDLPTWRHVQSVNVESALWLCQALAPAMSERGFGRIIFITSNTVWRPPAADFLPYVASKATLVGIARSLAKPLGESGITVNCVAPGLTRTPFTEADLPREAFDEARARQALPRSLVPDDVAGLVAFLASDAAAAITGQTLCADGGSVFA